MESELSVTDIRGTEVCKLIAAVVPCDATGKEIGPDSEAWLDEPKQNLGKPVHFVFKIKSASGLPLRFTDVFAKYWVSDS